MFRQKQYKQMAMSCSSLGLELGKCEDPTEISTEEEESREFERKSLLDAKIEKSMKAIEQTKSRSQSRIEKGATGLQADSHHSNVGNKLCVDGSEKKKRNLELSKSEHCQAVHNRKEKARGLSVSEHGKTRPTVVNRKSNLDLNTHEGNPLEVADVRRRRKSMNDELSPEEKRQARLLLARNRRRRSSSTASPLGEGQNESNTGEHLEERVETRRRLCKSGARRAHSLGDDIFGLQNVVAEQETPTRRNSSKKRLSGGSDSSRRISSGSNRPRQTPQRSSFGKTLSMNGDSPGSSNEPTRRSSSIRALSSESESGPTGSFRSQKATSALSLSELGRYESGSKSKVGASRRGSQNFRLSGTRKETSYQSTSEKKNFTWSWKNDKMESTLRRSIEGNGSWKTSPSQIKKAVRGRFGQDSFLSPSSDVKHTRTRRLSMPYTETPSSERSQTKISSKRTSKRADSLLTPGARRTSRAKEHFVSPIERTASQPNLTLSSPEAKKNSGNWKKTRGANHRRQMSTSKDTAAETAGLAALKIENTANTKDIGTIAQFLKLSNQAEEDLERQKEQERQAKRSHIRARIRQQTSIEWTTSTF